MKLKMTAAMRLDDLYARHEAVEARREARAQTAEPEPTETVPAEETVEARLARLRQQYGIGGPASE